MAASALKVVVVGAGVIGRAIAYYLALRRIEVEIIDAGNGPSATTRASLGVLTHFNGGGSPYSLLYRDGHDSFERLAARLLKEDGVDIGWRPLGGIDLIFTDADEARAKEVLHFNRQRGCRVEWVDAAALHHLERHISKKARGGIYFADDHRVDPEMLGHGLLRAVLRRGGRIARGETVKGIQEVAEDHVELRTRTGVRAADFAVLAAGSWTGALGVPPDVEISLRPIRGQHGRFRGGERLGHILRRDGFHLLPAGEHIVVGSTVEEAGFAAQSTMAAGVMFEDVFRRTMAWRPELQEQRAGLRPKPRGGRPIIGPLTGCPRIFVAAGHYKNGILLGPITGQVVGRWIATGDPGRDMTHFAVER